MVYLLNKEISKFFHERSSRVESHHDCENTLYKWKSKDLERQLHLKFDVGTKKIVRYRIRDFVSKSWKWRKGPVDWNSTNSRYVCISMVNIVRSWETSCSYTFNRVAGLVPNDRYCEDDDENEILGSMPGIEQGLCLLSEDVNRRINWRRVAGQPRNFPVSGFVRIPRT